MCNYKGKRLVCNLIVVNHIVQSFFSKDFTSFFNCNRALFSTTGTIHHIDNALHTVLKVIN